MRTALKAAPQCGPREGVRKNVVSSWHLSPACETSAEALCSLRDGSVRRGTLEPRRSGQAASPSDGRFAACRRKRFAAGHSVPGEKQTTVRLRENEGTACPKRRRTKPRGAGLGGPS